VKKRPVIILADHFRAFARIFSSWDCMARSAKKTKQQSPSFAAERGECPKEEQGNHCMGLLEKKPSGIMIVPN